MCCIISVRFSSKCRLFYNSTSFCSCIIHILNTGCAKIFKKISGTKWLTNKHSSLSSISCNHNILCVQWGRNTEEKIKKHECCISRCRLKLTVLYLTPRMLFVCMYNCNLIFCIDNFHILWAITLTDQINAK
jgi:hypothetical protein